MAELLNTQQRTFESATDPLGYIPGGTILNRTTSIARTGVASLELVYDYQGSSISAIGAYADPIAITGGQNYIISAYIRKDPAVTDNVVGRMGFAFVDTTTGSWTYMYGAQTGPVPSSSWLLASSGTIQAPASANMVYGSLGFDHPVEFVAGQKFYADDVSLQSATAPPPPVVNDSFEVDTNVFRTVDPLNQSDGFEIDSYVPNTTITQADGFDVDSYIRVSTPSNELVFTYVLTEITDLIPDPAPIPGGVTIIGVLLDKVTAVYMDGIRASYRKISDTEIWASIPPNVSSLVFEVNVEYEF